MCRRYNRFELGVVDRNCLACLPVYHLYVSIVIFDPKLLRFNPIFVLPVPLQSLSSPITHTPGRRTGTGSAAISSPSRSPSIRTPISGFRTVSLMSALRVTGRVPPYDYISPEGYSSTLEDIRMKADRPIVVFPECTTSNGRGMLRFADVFEGEILPVKKCQVFVMCVR
jgi:hypothetical protein